MYVTLRLISIYILANKELVTFAESLEKACIDTIESGNMTKDLAICVKGMAKLVPL